MLVAQLSGGAHGLLTFCQHVAWRSRGLRTVTETP